MKVLRLASAAALLAIIAALAYGFIEYRRIVAFRDTRYGTDAEKVIEVPPGATAHAVVRLLARGGALADEKLAWRYVRFLKRDRRPMRAGEYAFAGALRPDDVLERVYRGEVKVYRFTVPEGLRMEEIASVVEASGLAKGADLLALMRDPQVAAELGVPARNLEGYLFPDTYSFPKGPRPREILAAMVGRFAEEYRKADEQRLAGIDLSEPQAVTLASIIEKETGQPEERPRISCVFHNRLKRHVRLQTDPTVMYATMLRNGGRWSQNITKADLLTPHPYNTYTTMGLPPGPIASPGAASLRAALHPSDCSDLFFVSRNDGTHVFCADLACHEAMVKRWQIEFFRHRHATAPTAAPSQERPPAIKGKERAASDRTRIRAPAAGPRPGDG